MSNFELVNFINYDINKNNKLISKLTSPKGSYILFNNFDINTNNPDYIKDMNFENVIHIDLDEIITDIQSSFTSITEIQEQFVRDINRSYMTFNGHYIKNPSNVLDYLESKYRNTNPTLEKEILMLSTQSSFQDMGYFNHRLLKILFVVNFYLVIIFIGTQNIFNLFIIFEISIIPIFIIILG